jgi:hypothetical protein
MKFLLTPLVGLVCRSLLTPLRSASLQVSFDAIVGLFGRYSRSLLQVSFDTTPLHLLGHEVPKRQQASSQGVCVTVLGLF